MAVTQEEVAAFAKGRFDEAYKRCVMIKRAMEAVEHEEEHFVTCIDGYKEKLCKVTDFIQVDCCALFMDIRKSTYILRNHGPRVAYVVGQTFLSTMAYLIQESDSGTVVDYTGDGVYALFGYDGKHELPVVIQEAGSTAIRMMKTARDVVNPLIKKCQDITDNGTVNDFDYGIGLTVGRKVVITKIGSKQYSGIVAIGDCINTASKYSNGNNKILVSAEVYDLYPSSKDGKIKMTKEENDQYSVDWRNGPWG